MIIKKKTLQRGQGLAEFALILPVLLLITFIIFDAGRMLVAFASTSASVREAARKAIVVGESVPLYGDCAAIYEIAANNFFTTDETITLTWTNIEDGSTEVCTNPASPPTAPTWLGNGDLLSVALTSRVEFINPLIPVSGIDLNFSAQRTLMTELIIDTTVVIASDPDDTDGDGLSDAWEMFHFGDLDEDGTGDPDGDSYNNGFEEAAGTDPNLAIDNPGTNEGPTGSVIAVNDTSSTTLNTEVIIEVLANDTADATTVQITTAETPSNEGGTVSINDNGTTGDTTDDYLVYTPADGFMGSDYFSYTITDSTTDTDDGLVIILVSAPPPTPMPEPTPVDIAHTTFADTVIPPQDYYWRFNHGRVWVGSDDWDVEYWNGTASSGTQAETLMASTPCTSTLPFDQPIAFDWGTDGPSDCGVGTDGFAIRWSRTFGWACSDGDAITENDCINYPDYPDLPVTLTTIANDEMRVKINDSVVIDWGSSGTTSYNFIAGTEYKIEVEYYENSGDAVAAFIVSDGESDDVGICNWSQSTEESASPLYSMTDSPGSNYSLNSTCYLELRGTVNLSGMGLTPQMTFWDKWNLAATDNTRIEVREAGGSTWPYSETIHTGESNQTVWQEQEIDLTNFAGHDFTGTTIEFRFVLETDGATNDDGWWIDNIIIKEDTLKSYTIPFADDMESVNQYWTIDAGWATVADPVREGFGAWSAPTVTGSSSMQLNGEFIMPSDNGKHPELAFYHQYNLGTNEAVYVEISDTDDFASPIQLTGGAIQSTGSNGSFERVSIPLDAYWDDSFYLRFRIESDGSGGSWYIDDISIDYRDDTTLSYPFYDNMDVVNDYWLVNDQWAISTEYTRNNSGGAWSDSVGKNYTDGTNPSFQTARQIDMTSASSPELSFWHKRNLAATDAFIVEVSTDYGSNWTTVWDYTYNTAYTSSDGTPADQFNTQLAWERVAVDMSDYAGDLILLRFRLDATTDAAVGDGVWIDDILLGEYSVTNYEDSDNDGVAFSSDMGSLTNSDYDPAGGTANQYPDWHIGGTWGVETGHDGNAASDNPTDDYTTNTWSVLELADPIVVPAIDGDQFPVLSWWDKVDLANGDYARVQISRWNGSSWDGWTNIQPSSAPSTEALPHDYYTGHAWDFRQVDMSAYDGDTIRLRFVLDALQDSSSPDTASGWLIDEVELALYDPTGINMAVFNETGESLDNWIQEGSWGSAATSITTPGTGPDPVDVSWNSYFYDTWQFGQCIDKSGNAVPDGDLVLSYVFTGVELAASDFNTCKHAFFTLQAAAILDELNYSCGASGSPWADGTCSGNNDHTAAYFTSTITVPANTIYTLTVTHDTGARIYVNNSMVANGWGSSGTLTTSLTGGASYDVLIHYYEDTGDAALQVNVTSETSPTTQSLIVFNDSPNETYVYQNMALQLDGVVDLTGSTEPILYWDDKYVPLNGLACIYPEISLPYTEFDNWIGVGTDTYLNPDYDNEGCADASSASEDWTTRSVNLATVLNSEFGITNFAGVKLAVRFRLDARGGATTEDGEGWWIKNVFIQNSSGPAVDTDGDGISDDNETNGVYGYVTDPNLADTDSDGINDYLEVVLYITNPLDNDSDDDTILDGEEVVSGTDGYITDPTNDDTDGDSLLDGEEINTYGSNPSNVDSDSDTITDDEEVVTGTDGYVTNPANADTDGDAISDDEEIITGADGYITDPTNDDTDGDSISDGQEVSDGTDPTDPSDPPSIDADGDGILDDDETSTANGYITDPNDPDTDNDLLSDWQEIYDTSTFSGTNPTTPTTKITGEITNSSNALYILIQNYVANGLDATAAVASTSGLDTNGSGWVGIYFTCSNNKSSNVLSILTSMGYTSTNTSFVGNKSSGTFYIAMDDVQEYLWRASSNSWIGIHSAK